MQEETRAPTTVSDTIAISEYVIGELGRSLFFSRSAPSASWRSSSAEDVGLQIGVMAKRSKDDQLLGRIIVYRDDRMAYCAEHLGETYNFTTPNINELGHWIIRRLEDIKAGRYARMKDEH